MKVYNFNDSLKEGEFFENILDLYFKKFYHVENVNIEKQKKGIDRIFIRNTIITKVEYKADKKTKETGNVFIETISNDVNLSEGWSVKSESDIIAYYCLGVALFILETNVLRKSLPNIINNYPKVTCKNENYSSHGRLFPIKEFEKLCKNKISELELLKWKFIIKLWCGIILIWWNHLIITKRDFIIWINLLTTSRRWKNDKNK